MGNLNVFMARMKYWCKTVSLGYDQYHRWNIRPGGSCDCSSLVIWCLREAGFPTGGAVTTGNLSAALTALGYAVSGGRTPSGWRCVAARWPPHRRIPRQWAACPGESERAGHYHRQAR